ncbi:MAG: hypothetical protein GY787_26935 [Alteromonadales bacterium]|nr:hypothetical protein [Alteromonadales bacterium]
MNKKSTLLILGVMLGFNAYAQDTTENNSKCSSFNTSETTFFKGSYRTGKVYGEALCQFYTGHEDSPTYEELIRLSNDWQAQLLYESADLIELAPNLEDYPRSLNKSFISDYPFNTVAFYGNNELSIKIDNKVIRSVFENGDFCKVSFGDNISCRDVIENYASVANLPTEPIKTIQSGNALKQLKLYSKQWQRYYTDARSQTFIDIALNSYLNRKDYRKGEPVSPPSEQLFALHPSVVFQYVDGAEDGEQFKEALVIEWVGYNNWDAPLPLGVSLVSLYSDRVTVDDVGHGLMFHIDNNYSIGVTKHDDETGIFITVDLLKLFEEKQSNYKRHVSKIKGYLN